MPTHYLADAWEACASLGDHGWAWAKTSKNMSSETVIHLLVKAVARNGNLVIGIGPDAQGVLDPEVVKILNEIGIWLKVNGEAIYNTRPIKPYESGNLFFTTNQNGTVYAINILSKTDSLISNKVRIPSTLVALNSQISLVGFKGEKLHYQPVAGDMVEITLPAQMNLRLTPAVTFKISK